MIQNQIMQKKVLGQILGYKPGTWTRVLNTLEPEIKIIHPGYNKLSSLLIPKVVRFIIDQLTGISEQEFNEMAREWQSENLQNAGL